MTEPRTAAELFREYRLAVGRVIHDLGGPLSWATALGPKGDAVAHAIETEAAADREAVKRALGEVAIHVKSAKGHTSPDVLRKALDYIEGDVDRALAGTEGEKPSDRLTEFVDKWANPNYPTDIRLGTEGEK